MAKISETVASPVTKVLRNLATIRGQAHKDLLKLPTNDPMRDVLDRVDGILQHTESAIIRTAQRPPGVDTLEYLQSQLRKLEQDIGRAKAIPGEIVMPQLPSPRRRLK